MRALQPLLLGRLGSCLAAVRPADPSAGAGMADWTCEYVPMRSI